MASIERSDVPTNFPNRSGQICEHGMWHPAVRFLEFVHITDSLRSRISRQSNHTAIFANVTDRNPHLNTMCQCVVLPFNPNPSSPSGNELDCLNDPEGKWVKIKATLLNLKTLCESDVSISNVGKLMCDTIEAYCPDVNKCSNFDVLSNHEIGELVVQQIPNIIMLAIQLPHLLSKDIPVLESRTNGTIHITRKLCACLLANAFLCTFPAPGENQNTPDFNFFLLYHTDSTFTEATVTKREKLKCILNYFHIISKDSTGHHQIVSFERRYVLMQGLWGFCTSPFTSVTVENQGKIEDCHQMLQVDFANRVIGGGVYRGTCVMEDIRFCISPELIVAKLFTQNLQDNEVLVVTGSEIFSQYSGFAETFSYREPVNVNFDQATDAFGRTYTQVVAMDAYYFEPNNRKQQYEQKYIDRELHKCCVAFAPGESFVSPVATGNWGCGQFNGDRELKFLIQWMAASLQNRPNVQFHTIQDVQFGNKIHDITNYLSGRNVTVAALYKVVCRFKSDYAKRGRSGIFNYIKAKISRGNP